MKKVFALICFLSPVLLYDAAAQNTGLNDTASYPYWIGMMQNDSVNFYDVQRAFNLYWENREITKGSGYKPFRRWEYRMQHIVNQDGSRPVADHVVREVSRFNSGTGNQNMPAMRGSQGSSVNLPGNWRETGPIYLPSNGTSQPNGLGRINAIAFHPVDSNVFYAGAPSGGLWKTTDFGQTWVSYTDTLVTLGVSDIAIHPTRPDTVYIGTGDRDGGDAPGMGVMKSMDGGVSWTAANSGMGNRTVSKLLIHPTNPDILIAAVNGGIYKTTNGGQSWTRTSSNTSNYKDLVFKPNNPSVVYASAGYYFYRSTNTGDSWTRITNGLPSGGYRGAIAVTKSDSDYVYFIVTNSRTFYGLYRSTNGGSSFSTRSTTPNIMDYSTDGSGNSGQAWYDLDIAVDPDNKDIVYVGGINIFKSVDGGQTWTINAHWVGQGGAEPIHADQHCLEFSPVTDGFYSGNDGGVYYTTDGGNNWIDISSGLAIAQIYKIGQSATNRNDVINGYQDNGTSIYFGFGNWITTIGGDGFECIFDPDDPDYVYGALYYGDIRRSVNGGGSFGTIAKNGTNGISESGAWVTPYILHEKNPNTMFAGYKNVWRSDNVKVSGNSSVIWKKISDNLGGSNSQKMAVLEQSPADTNILYAARYDKKLFRTDSACGWNPQWTNLTSGLPGNSVVRDMEAHPTQDSVVYMCHHRDVYKSTDYGVSWTNISSNLPNISMNTIVYDQNSNEGLYVGTDAGVYYKDSGMTSWISFSEGLPWNAEITELEIYYDSTDHRKSMIKASTYGRGLWESSLYVASPQKPKALFYASDSLGCMGTVIRFEDASFYEPAGIRWEFSPNYITYLENTDSSSHFPVVSFDSIASYTVSLYATNSNGTDTLVRGNMIRILESLPVASCVTNTTNGAGFGIGIYKVKVANIEKITSGFDGTNSYHDYSCVSNAILESGQTYQMDVTVGSYNSEYVNAFIDYNNDNDFNDPGELVMSTGKYKNLHTANFTVPAGALKNTKLRMRVVSDYYNIGGNACKTLGYGESEDYAVIINEIIPGFTASDTLICQHDFVTFTDTSKGISSMIDWDFGDGASPRYLSGPGPHQVQYTTSGQKTIILSLDNNNQKSIRVHVNKIPNGQITLVTDSNQCYGESFSLTFNDSSLSNLQYRWYQDGNLLSGQTDSTLLINSLVLNDSGSYHSIIENNGCYDTSEQVRLKVYDLPAISFAINDSDQCLSGNNFLFTNSTTNALTYSWDFGDNLGSSATSPSHSYSSSGNYQVRLIATGQNQCQDSMQLNVYVRSMPIAGFSINDTDQCLGNNSFTITNMSSGAQNYFYDLGDGNTSNNVSPVFNYLNYGNYTIRQIVTSSYGCQDSIDKTVEVYSMPVAGFSVSDSDQCLAGNHFIFTNQSSNASNYLWDFGNGQTSTNVSPSLAFSKTGNYIIKLVVQTIDGCQDSVVREIYVREMPMIDFTIKDTAQCLVNNNFIFTNSSIGTVHNLWDFGNGSFSTSFSTMHQYANSGDYKVKLVGTTQYGCLDSVEKNISVFPMPVAKFDVDSLQCLSGNQFKFSNLSTGAIQFLWDFGNGDTSSMMNPAISYQNAGRYTVELIITSDKQCEDHALAKVTVRQSPVADFSVNDSAQCLKENVFVLTNNSQYNQKSSWQMGDGNEFYLDSLDYSYLLDGEFEIRLYVDTAGCTDSLVKSIIVFPDPEADFTATNVCLGEESMFTNVSTIRNPYVISDYKWMFTSSDSSEQENPAFTFADTGKYNVRLYIGSDKGCLDTVEKTVEVYGFPDASFLFTYGLNGEVSFNALEAQASAYKWYFGDGDSSDLKNPIHTYPHNLDYYPELYVTSLFDCRSNSLDTVNIRNITSIEDIITEEYNLSIYPNPFENTFTISFDLNDHQKVEIELIDSYGKLIKVLSKDILHTGKYQMEVDANQYAAGVYFLKIRIGREEGMKKLIRI